ncbi:hypothetical protein T03_7929 [Trichinella britovi]|uniref:Uncharacterized protein n=1 Tax=Trichinella britovi TaxID=45882 RepID=A0A0V1D5Q1_TRIBR|nr:hypothetical protein T03_7929 [Trichinella britovi]
MEVSALLKTEADLKPSNDEVIAFNKKGNIGTAADCSDLSMGPTDCCSVQITMIRILSL